RFSIEGSDVLVPMLDVAIEAAATHGAREVDLAMAHRGRINVLAHTLGKPYASIFEEFEGKHATTNAVSETGDVKYHLGASGTRHIIVNNQVGFTTDPIDARSTRHASDLAKGFEVPIVHVNADDAESCIHVVRLAIEYRAKFGKDFLIDLVGYRRHGHNETDEPAFTQPTLYKKIRAHPSPREVWASRLVAEGIVTAEEVKKID